MLVILGLSLVLSAPDAATAGPCDLLDRATAGQLLGQAVAAGTPSGPEPDEDSGGTRRNCVYQAGKSLLVLTQVTFASAAAAREATTRELVGERLGEEDFTVKEESGLGDKAYWAYSEIAAQYIVVKGPNVLGLALGGTGQAPSSYQASLRAAAAKAAARL
ncbi:MAG TPA: hypothetical protein VH879_13015 [Gemmatimonadales bacterium]|jgi:hypothetical protein